MNIALDYDETFTRDPEGWVKSITELKKRGHNVYGVSMRYDAELKSMDKAYVDLVDRLYLTQRRKKREYMDNLQVRIDVWIDDTPEFIVY